MLTKLVRSRSFICILVCLGLFAQRSFATGTTLSKGDLAIVSLDCQTGLYFAFACWVDLAPGTQINFTTNNCNASGSAAAASHWNAGNQIIVWENTDGVAIPAGTLIQCGIGSGASSVCSHGTQTAIQTNANVGGFAGTYLVLPNNGKTFFAYQGAHFSANGSGVDFLGNLLFGFCYQGGGGGSTTWLTTGTVNALKSYLPTELSGGLYDIDGLPATTKVAQYIGSRSSQTSMAAYQALVTDPGNWATGSGPQIYDATSFTIPGSSNSAPTFAGGSPQSLTLCQDAAATSINSYLTINDADASQTETWTISGTPSHGSIVTGTTHASGTGVSPTGFTYQPTAGYSGTDAFTMQVSDGNGGTATTTINVTVNALPSITPGSNPSVAEGTTTANLGYSVVAGSPNTYSIAWTGIASGVFATVTNASLSGGNIVITVPAGASAGNTYPGTLTVKNSNNCVSTTYSVSVQVTSTPTTTINSITPASATTNASSLNYTATFGGSITTIAANNFSLTTTGVSGASITGISGSGATRTVTVNTGSGDGTIKVNLDNNTSMSPGISTTLPFAGTSAIIDKTAPTASSLNRQTPSGVSTNATTLVYRITFSENVNNVGISDFTLVSGGTTSGTVSSVSASSGTTIDVTVNAVSGDGTLELDLNSSGTGITDDGGNAISGGITGQSYTLDHTTPTIISINRQTPSSASTNATSLTYRVTFSENVSGVDITDFTLTAGTTATGTVASVSASSGTVIDVIVNAVSGDGTLRLDLKSSGTGIIDDLNNAISGGYTSGQTYSLDHTAPTVSNINRQAPSGATTNATTLIYRVTFSETINGVDVTDFMLTAGGTGSGTIASVSASSGTVIDVTVNSVSGEGSLRLDLKSGGTGITDDISNAISGGYTSGQSYTLDNTAPIASSLNRQTPSAATNNATTLVYRITFSENVSNVDISDFSLVAGGSASGTISSVSASSGTTIDITVNAVSGDGTLELDLNSSGTGITDDGGNALSGGILGQSYTLDHTTPSISSINRQTPLSASTNATTLIYRVTFSENVSGVDITDFTLTASGSATGTIASVSASSGTTIDVTVNTVSGEGTLRLDLNPVATGITDATGNAISSGYTAGQAYTLDHTAPAVHSITRAGSTPTNLNSLDFTLSFSEAVTGVDISDFTLATTGTATGSISAISGSGDTYTVTVNTVSGSGDLQLDLNPDSTGISDAVGNAINLGYSIGEAYTIDQSVPVVTSVDVPLPGNYTTGQNLDFTVNWSEAVTVDATGGTPYITIALSSGTVHALYLSGDGTNALVFRYVLAGGNRDFDGIVVGASISLDGSTLRDAATNNGNLTLNSIGNTTAVYVNNTIPVFTNGASQAFSLCANSAAYDITALLHVNDPDAGETETWTIAVAADNGGTITGFGTANTAAAGTADITPGNSVAYTPAPGFSGTETFIIQTSDGIGGIASTQFTVTVSPLPVINTATNDGPICAGTTLHLSGGAINGTGTLNYAWYGPNSFNMPGANPTIPSATVAASGTYTLVVTDASSCADTAATSTTVYPQPNITAIGNNAPVCEENTLTLSSTVTGGIIPYTYSWSGPNSFSSADEDPIVTTDATVAADGTYVLSVTDGHSCAATGTNTTSVTVYPIQPVTGSTTVLFGQTITLDDLVPGGTWSTATPWTTSVVSNTGVVKGISAGTSVITYTTTHGCTATYTVTCLSGVNACVGQTIVLSDGIAVGGTWTSSSASIATVTGTGVVTGVNAGNVVITHKLSSGTTTTTSVKVNPLGVTTVPVTNVCQGQVLTLTNSTAGGGTWYSGNTSVAVVNASGAVTGFSGGTVTIYFTPVAGCVTAKTITINGVAPITGLNSVCASQSISLSNTVTGGSWSTSNGSMATVYLGTVTGVAAGVPIITYKYPNGCFATIAITVRALSQIVSGSTIMCQNTTMTLSDGTPGGGTWTSDPIFSINSSGLVTALNPGTGNIYFNASTNCMATRTVTIKPAAIITGTPSVCVGQTTLLHSSISGGNWSTSSGSQATVYNGIVGGVGVGTPKVTYVIPTGCNGIVSVTVNALSPISGGSTSICPVGTTTFTNATPGGGAWSSSLTSVANISSFGLVTGAGAVPGSKTVISFTSAASACVATRTVTIVACRENNATETVGVTVAEINVQLFPNPNNGTFTLKGKLDETSGEEANAEVVNMLGQVVYSRKIRIQDNHIDERIQLAGNLAPGIYILNLRTSSGNSLFHFVMRQ